MREHTIDDVHHPDVIHGHRVVRLGEDLHDLADRIKNGDPVQGWEGDVRLTLARFDDPSTGPRYELWRLEADGEYRLVAKLPAYRDPSGIIRQLVERDARRGYDVRVAVERHNTKVQAAKDSESADRLGAASDRLAWALKKDLGVRTQWAAPTRKVEG